MVIKSPFVTQMFFRPNTSPAIIGSPSSLMTKLYISPPSTRVSRKKLPSVDSVPLPPSSVNKPPSFHPPHSNLQTFAGENFVFQFAASDPEGSALLFQLEEAPPGAVLSPAGLLIWRVPLLPGAEAEEAKEEEGRSKRHSFRLMLSDECNAQSTVTLEVELGGKTVLK